MEVTDEEGVKSSIEKEGDLQIEMLKQGFLEAVKLGRTDALKMADAEILRGQIYMGSEALRKG